MVGLPSITAIGIHTNSSHASLLSNADKMVHTIREMATETRTSMMGMGSPFTQRQTEPDTADPKTLVEGKHGIDPFSQNRREDIVDSAHNGRDVSGEYGNGFEHDSPTHSRYNDQRARHSGKKGGQHAGYNNHSENTPAHYASYDSYEGHQCQRLNNNDRGRYEGGREHDYEGKYRYEGEYGGYEGYIGNERFREYEEGEYGLAGRRWYWMCV